MIAGSLACQPKQRHHYSDWLHLCIPLPCYQKSIWRISSLRKVYCRSSQLKIRKLRWHYKHPYTHSCFDRSVCERWNWEVESREREGKKKKTKTSSREEAADQKLGPNRDRIVHSHKELPQYGQQRTVGLSVSSTLRMTLPPTCTCPSPLIFRLH